MLIAGPNLTIDRTSTIAELRPGAVLRAERVVVTPGGKGVDVARAARSLGANALLVAFVAGDIGRAAATMVAREGIALRGVPCAGELRSTAIVMERSGRTTVLNEPGPAVTAAEWAALEAAVAEELPRHAVLLCSGSIPPGCPIDAYGRLTALAESAGRRSVVDAGGPTLVHALSARPGLVCPNLAEAEDVLGLGAGDEPIEAADDARPRALTAAAALLERGAGAAVVTAAAAGAALASSDAPPSWLPAPRANVVRNPMGAGDAFAGALVAALERGEPLVEAARHGVAAATASVESPTAGDLVGARAAELLRGVVVEPA